MMAGDWLSLSEAAEMLGVHPSTVRSWANQGLLPSHRTEGGHRRFRRDDVALWIHTRQNQGNIEFSAVAQNALKHMRLEISAGKLEQASWYQKLDAEARDQYRQSGRSLLLGLVGFLSAREASEMDPEARSLGYEYASRGKRFGLSSVEAVNALLFFRNSMIDALVEFYRLAGVRSPQAWANLIKRVQLFTDEIMITLLDTYEAYQRGGK
jgi:excisionase family DNA binding protein